MSDDVDVDLDADGDDIDPTEYRRMLNRALREGDRRLREGKLGDTSLSRYMSQAVTYLAEERLERAKSEMTPAQAVESDDEFTAWLLSNRERIGENQYRRVTAEYVVRIGEAQQRACEVLGVTPEAETQAAELIRERAERDAYDRSRRGEFSL